MWSNIYWVPLVNFFLSLVEFILTLRYVNDIANIYKKMSLIFGEEGDEVNKKKEQEKLGSDAGKIRMKQLNLEYMNQLNVYRGK